MQKTTQCSKCTETFTEHSVMARGGEVYISDVTPNSALCEACEKQDNGFTEEDKDKEAYYAAVIEKRKRGRELMSKFVAKEKLLEAHGNE